MAKYSKDKIQAALKAKGYVFFEDVANKGLDLNIVGVRNSDTGKKVTNAFDDVITVSYKKMVHGYITNGLTLLIQVRKVLNNFTMLKVLHV